MTTKKPRQIMAFHLRTKVGDEKHCCFNSMKLSMHVRFSKKPLFFNEPSCEHELTEHCPQVIEPGSPPRTNPNHPTVSSLVSRGPQSLVSHGCLTTPLSQCTLCLHLFNTSLSWTHHSPLATYSHTISSHLRTSPVKQSLVTVEERSRTPVICVSSVVQCCHVTMLLVYSCESKVIYSLDLTRSSIPTEYLNSLWTVVRLLE